MNTDTAISAELEVLQPSAVEALERAAVDVQISTAHRFPRSLEQFKKRALSMATLDVETAESCMYSRPVGGGKMAEGASIRLAEIVAASYGNIRVAARVIEQTPRFVKCEGVAHDLESNYAAKSEVVEATLKKDGTPYDERMRIVIVKATLSKAFRDAVFKVVPKALCKTVIDAAIKTAAGDEKSLEERRGKAKVWVKSLKIDEARVFAVINVQGWSDVTQDHLNLLTGLRTAMTDGDVTIDEAFPPVSKAPKIFGGDRQEQSEKTPTPKTETAQVTNAVTCPKCKSADVIELNPGEFGCNGCKHSWNANDNVPMDFTPDLDKPMESLQVLMKRDGVTEEQLVKFCVVNKILKADATKVTDLAQSRLVSLVSKWKPELVASIKAAN